MRPPCLTGLLLSLATASAVAGQTIQLPSFSSFSVSTTVLVPDSGPAPSARDRRPPPSLFRYEAFPTPSARQLEPGKQVVIKPGANDVGLSSVTGLQEQRAARAVAQDREAQLLVEKARQAKTAGKSSLALNYYRAAAKSASEPLKAKIEAEAQPPKGRKF